MPKKHTKKSAGPSAGSLVKGALTFGFMAAGLAGKQVEASSVNFTKTDVPDPMDPYDVLANTSAHEIGHGLTFIELPPVELEAIYKDDDVDLESLPDLDDAADLAETASVTSEDEVTGKRGLRGSTKARTKRGPTKKATQAPIAKATKAPTKPTKAPTKVPTMAPTKPTKAPTKKPTTATAAPTKKATQAPTTAAPIKTGWDESDWVGSRADKMISHGYHVPDNGDSIFLTFEITNPAKQKIALLFGGVGAQSPYSFTVGIDRRNIFAINIGAKYPRLDRPGNPFDGSVRIACLCHGNYMARAQHDGQDIIDPTTGSYGMMDAGPIFGPGKFVVEVFRDASGDINFGINGERYSPKVLNGLTVDPPSFSLETTAFWDPNYGKTPDGKILRSVLGNMYVKAPPGMKVSYSTEDPRNRRRLSI